MTTSRRILVPCLLVAFGILAASGVRAETPKAPAVAAVDDWAGPGGLYRIVATSVGVLAGAGAMSLFIDGWVVDAFTSSSGMSVSEAASVVQDLDSQGGVEAAAILLAGLGGGLVADHAYVAAGQVLPGLYQQTRDVFAPTFGAVGSAWSASTGWVTGHVADGSDWVQARSRELWDRGQVWLNSLNKPSAPTATLPAGPPEPGHR